MLQQQFDVIVIGSGPAGESAALNAAKHHKSVAVVEVNTQVGAAALTRVLSRLRRYDTRSNN